MQKQTVEIIVEKTKDGQIKTIGKSIIMQPEIKFSGGTVKWYEDKMKNC